MVKALDFNSESLTWARGTNPFSRVVRGKRTKLLILEFRFGNIVWRMFLAVDFFTIMKLKPANNRFQIFSTNNFKLKIYSGLYR